MRLEFALSDRFHAAAEEWAEIRLTDTEDALDTKVEQALLEVEHLVSGAHDVDFDREGRTVVYEPTDELAALLERQAAERDLDPAAVLALHVDLFAGVFLDSGEERPPNAPPRE